MSLACCDATLGYPDGLPIVAGLSLSVAPGEILGISGPSGCGKSTVLRALAGSLVPIAGSIKIHERVSDGSPSCKRFFAERAALVPQLPEQQLFAATVFDEVAFGPRNLGLAEDEVEHRVHRALACVGLDRPGVCGTSPFAHSGGERRRIALADMLALETPYLLLDEPTAGLDPRGRDRLLACLRDLADRGRGIVVVSHDACTLAACDRVFDLGAHVREKSGTRTGEEGRKASPSYGIYRNGRTLAHSLDPAARVLFCALYLVAAFVAAEPLDLALVSIACILALAVSGIDPSRALRTLKPFWALMLFVLVFNALFTASGTVLAAVGPLALTSGGAAFGLVSILRFALVLLGTSGLMATASPTELADATNRLLKPLTALGIDIDGITLTTELTLRFVPVLVEEYRRVRAAQEARLATFDQSNPLSRAQAFVPLIVPLFAGALRRSEDLALAIQNREYGMHPEVARTCIRAYKITARDLAVVAGGLALLVIVLV